MTKHPLSFLGGALAGALAMYYLDTEQGDRRRALLRDMLTSRGQDMAGRARDSARSAMDRARGFASTHMHRDQQPGSSATDAQSQAGEAGQASPGGSAWH